MGSRALWKAQLLVASDEYYVLTDPDLDISGIPLDAVEHLKKGFSLMPNVMKSGYSLRIDDLPCNPHTEKLLRHEKLFWQRPISDEFYNAPIDTTFALYRNIPATYGQLSPAVRSAPPYMALHLPWYLLGLAPNDLPEEYRYYLETVKPEFMQSARRLHTDFSSQLEHDKKEGKIK